MVQQSNHSNSFVYLLLVSIGFTTFLTLYVSLFTTEILPVNPLYFHTSAYAVLLMAVLMEFGCNNQGSEVITHYEITGFRATLLSADQINNAYGKVNGTLLKKGDSVNYQQLALHFESKKNILSSTSDQTTLFPELPSSYIFGPVSADSIAEISVFSDQDFDEHFRAGDDLSEKFVIIPESLIPHTDKTSALSLAEFSKKTQPGRGVFTLMLSEKPSLSTIHQFTVHYRKTDNSLYILNFPPIRIF